MKQNRNVSYLNQNKTKLNYVIKFSLIECSLFITIFNNLKVKSVKSNLKYTKSKLVKKKTTVKGRNTEKATII